MDTRKLTRYPSFIMLMACAVFILALAACRPVNVTLTPPPAATQIPATAQPTLTTPPPPPTSGDLVLNLNDVAQDQTVETIAAAPPSADAPYWNAAPQHRRITMHGYPVTSHLMQPQIFIYPAADFVGVNETAVRSAAVLPITHPESPVSAQQANNVNDFPAYMTETVTWLEQQPANSFIPDLTKLDALIQSIEVK